MNTTWRSKTPEQGCFAALTKATFIIIAAFALDILGTIWAGYVLSVIWGWILVPTFGLPPISVPVAIGVALIVGFLAKPAAKPVKAEGRSMGELFAQGTLNMIARPAMALFIGWVLTFWM